MKHVAFALVLALVVCGSAFADDQATVPSAFQKYLVAPTQLVHRGAWGLLTLVFKVGKAPIDAAFELVGSALGSDPNKPLWE